MNSVSRQKQLEAIERWFVARGLPHFVERRPSPWEIWGRAIPLLVVTYLLRGLNALDLAGWGVVANGLAALFVIATLVLIWVGANWMRDRPLLRRPDTIGPVELGLFVIVPAIPPLIVGQFGDAVQALVQGVIVLLAAWALTSYGVVPLMRWAGRQTRAHATSFLNVVVRGLPLLLLFMTFLLINAEVWEVAGNLAGPVYFVVLALFFVLGSAFLLSRMPALMRAQNRFDSWTEIAETVKPTEVLPASAVDDIAAGSDIAGQDRPPFRQRLNVGLVALFAQAIQITVTVAAMFVFFVVFAFLAIDADTTAGWTSSDQLNVLLDVSFGGRQLVLTEAALRVAGFLAAFAGMYFTVVLSTDATYREELSEDIGPELREALAMRRLYRRLLATA